MYFGVGIVPYNGSSLPLASRPLIDLTVDIVVLVLFVGFAGV